MILRASAGGSGGKRLYLRGGAPHGRRGTLRLTYSTADMFNGATLVVTPYKGTDLGLMNALSMFFKKLGFARLKFTTTEEHDAMIAYTSQLAHVVFQCVCQGCIVR